MPGPLSGSSFSYLEPSPPDPEWEIAITFTSPSQASRTHRIAEKETADCAPRTVAWTGRKS